MVTTIDSCKTLVHFFKQPVLNRQLRKSSADEVYDDVTALLAQNESVSYIADIKRRTLQAILKQLKSFDEATHKLSAGKKEMLHACGYSGLARAAL